MSNNNLFTLIVNAFWDVGVDIRKKISNLLGIKLFEFNNLFKELKLCNKSELYPRFYNYTYNEYSITYTFTVPTGLSVENFKKHQSAIEHFIGVDSVTIERNNKFVDIKILTKTPYIEYNPEEMKRKDFKIPLGYDLNNNKLILWDITSSNNCHCYIAGSSGGGKSITLRLILSHLVNSKSKRDIEFSIINTKRVDLKDFQYAKHTVKYMTGIEGVEEFLEEELEEMDRRYRLFEKYDCDDLKEFRSKRNKVPYRIIVVEEISSYKENKKYQRSIELLASQGRGAGMILLMVTQLPSAKIMPNTIKCNVNSTIGLKTKDSIRSEIIAGEGANLHKLKGNGHSKLFDSSHDGIEYQGLYIDKMVMKEIIKSNSKHNKRVALAGTNATHSDNKNLS